MPLISRYRYALSLVCTLLLSVASVQAREVVTEADVSVGALYSDNICLLNENEIGEWVGTVTPAARITRNGARSTLDMYASVRMNTLEISSPACNTRGTQQGIAPRLRLSNNNELLSDWLFLDADLWANQNSVNAFRPGSTDNINGTDNVNTSYRYAIAPYLSRRVTRTSSVLLRYNWEQSFNSQENVQDSEASEVLFSFGQDPQLTRFSMGVTGRYSEVTYLSTTNRREVTNELSSAEVRAAYRVNNHWQLNGYVGEEWNDFVSGSGDIDGSYWDLGVLWTPNRRISVGAGIGDRFFGSAPRFDISYRHKRSTFVTSYSRTLTYQRNLRTSDDFFDGIGDIADNDAGQADSIAGTPTTNTPSPLLNEMFRARYSFKGRRTSVSVDGYYSEQTRAQDGFTDVFQRVGVTAQRSLWRNLDGVVGITWFGREPDPGRVGIEQVRNSETWRFNLGVSRLLAANTTLKLNYWHTQRESDFPLDQYTENRFEVSFKYTF